MTVPRLLALLNKRLSAVPILLVAAALVCPGQVTFTEYVVPTASSSPNQIAVGPDGNLWFAESTGDKIGRITPAGVITEYALPAGSTPLGIAVGPDANLWFTEEVANKIGRITPSGVITEFSIPTSDGYPDLITAGPDGSLWFAEYHGNKIGRITPAGVITEFPIPTVGSGPSGIAAGPDGNLWFTEYDGNRIGRITIAGVITEFPVPTSGSAPFEITTGPDGNLWFTEFLGTKIGSITVAGVITEFPVPTGGAVPTGITRGPDGNLWFAEGSGNKIGRITPAGVITEFSVPTGGSGPEGIVTGPDGNLWFTEYFASKIVKVNLGPPADTVGPITSSVTITPNPLAVNTSSSLSATVSDATTGGSNIASAYYTINGGTPYQMLLTPSGAVTTHASAGLAPFAQSNLYNVCVHGTDMPGNTGADACILLPVYDPNGGSISGGGRVLVPPSPFNSSPTSATFDFEAKYSRGSSTPRGSLEFELERNDKLHFESKSLDWMVLVRAQRHAIIRGTGTLNEKYVCRFEADAWAGSFQPGNRQAFGLKIFDCTGGSGGFTLATTPMTQGRIEIDQEE